MFAIQHRYCVETSLRGPRTCFCPSRLPLFPCWHGESNSSCSCWVQVPAGNSCFLIPVGQSVTFSNCQWATAREHPPTHLVSYSESHLHFLVVLHKICSVGVDSAQSSLTSDQSLCLTVQSLKPVSRDEPPIPHLHSFTVNSLTKDKISSHWKGLSINALLTSEVGG